MSVDNTMMLPAVCTWLTTESTTPGFPEGAGVAVAVPTSNPAEVIWEFALAVVCPTMLGTASFLGP